MNLLDLPNEILRSIVQQYYGRWSIHIRKVELAHGIIILKLEVSGVPSRNLRLTCRELSANAREIETQSFTGELYVEESSSQMGLTCESFVNSIKSGKQLQWLRDNIKVIKFCNPSCNPAIWKFPPRFHHFPDFPALQSIELDCRYPHHFAIHNVESMADFLANKEDRLSREMDYRQSFFLSCEKFLRITVCDGIAVRVIRAMGVREGGNKCQAVAVAVDYVEGEAGQVVLDWKSLKTSSAAIDGWPHNIRKTVESLSV